MHVPHIDAIDDARGLVLLEDLGSVPYLTRLRAGADVGPAVRRCARQRCCGSRCAGVEAARALPPYDRAALEREMALMPEWFCERHLQLALDDADRALLAESFEFLTVQALAQPQVFVHRDYHSRNLMRLPNRNPGIIDFQDALAGAVGYDLVSLLKDCYIDWPRARVEHWVQRLPGAPACAAPPNWPARASRVPALVRSDRTAASHQGARHLRAPVVSRRQARLSAGSAAHARVRAASGRRFTRAAGLRQWLQRRIVPAFGPANARALAAERP